MGNKILRKSWKGNKPKVGTSLLSHQRRREIKEERKKKAEIDRAIVDELKQNKKAFYEKIKEQKEIRKQKKRKK